MLVQNLFVYNLIKYGEMKIIKKWMIYDLHSVDESSKSNKEKNNENYAEIKRNLNEKFKGIVVKDIKVDKYEKIGVVILSGKIFMLNFKFEITKKKSNEKNINVYKVLELNLMLKDELVVNPSKYDVLNATQDYLCKFSTQNFPSRFLLIKRLSLFFKDRLEFALNLPTYFNSKDKANNFGLFDSLKSFIFYILPYRDLFQKKCSFCAGRPARSPGKEESSFIL